jgi:hypothetical protein
MMNKLIGLVCISLLLPASAYGEETGYWIKPIFKVKGKVLITTAKTNFPDDTIVVVSLSREIIEKMVLTGKTEKTYPSGGYSKNNKPKVKDGMFKTVHNISQPHNDQMLRHALETSKENSANTNELIVKFTVGKAFNYDSKAKDLIDWSKADGTLYKYEHRIKHPLKMKGIKPRF